MASPSRATVTAALNPLLDLCHQWAPHQLLLLGDLIHAREGLTPALRQTLLHLHELCACEVVLIGGNHDRHSWIEGLPQQPSRQLGSLWLSHIPERPRLQACSTSAAISTR